MRIGHLDRRITLIQPIITTGDSNEDKVTGWEVLDSTPDVWAEKIENSGRTLVDADRVTFSQTTSWIIRFREDLNVRNRLVFNTKVYEIFNISEIPNDRDRYLKIETNFLDNIYFT
jgi:SPP1 family predicted phage head-tail adaptor